MILSNYHTHSNFSDGKNTPEEMVQRAIELGYTSLGFSDHAYARLGAQWCMKKERQTEYYGELEIVKAMYKDKINIYRGLELDGTSPVPEIPLDYTIGSVHFVEKDGGYIVVDSSFDTTMSGVNTLYGGDFYSFARDYFKVLAELNLQHNCDIVGHFDLISKFNEDKAMFEDDCPEYRDAWQPALRELLRDKSRVFEVNTGAISRGYRKTPYPTVEMLSFIKQHGGTVIVTTDCHNRDFLDCAIGDAYNMLEELCVRYIDFEEMLGK